MPKKTHGRPTKGKTRARRPQRPIDTAATTAEPVADAPVAAAAVPVTRPAAQTAPRAAVPAAAARRGASQRRTPVIAINYDYLRRDIRTLAVLAPLMVVVLVVAYALLHNA